MGFAIFDPVWLNYSLAWAMEIRTLLKYYHRLHRLEIILDSDYISEMGSEVDVERPLSCEHLLPVSRKECSLPALPPPAPQSPNNGLHQLEAKCEIPATHNMYKLPAITEDILK